MQAGIELAQHYAAEGLRLFGASRISRATARKATSGLVAFALERVGGIASLTEFRPVWVQKNEINERGRTPA
jgi:hypothetical protein